MTSKVFVPHEEVVWASAVVLNPLNSKGEVEVKIVDEALPNEKGSRLVNLAKHGLSELPLQNTEIKEFGASDMCNLPYLHEPSILDNLKRRFAGKMPYTYTGDICIAVNPYQWLDIYTPALRDQYGAKKRTQLPPHAYATSASAYVGLTKRGMSQSILVSGESGAGKTETVKIMMGHVTHIASHIGNNTIDKLLKANPLLESFGNAKTVRNDNSSRFGKFSQLQFDGQHRLVGSKCDTYLLEKSRVVSQFGNERNYHILYQILSAPVAVKKSLSLYGRSAIDFTYVNGGDTSTTTIEGRSDADRFLSTIDALSALSVAGPVLDQLLTALAAVLFLGQINILQMKDDPDASVLDTGDANPKSSSQTPRSSNIRTCCSLLGVDASSFSNSIVTRTIDVEGQKLPVPMTREQAIGGRDALAKEIYSRIFQWLVMVINYNTASGPATGGECVGTISLLDIFGFESFAVNRFEQLCINYANEKLQQKFTQDVLKTVQLEYEQESIVWSHIQINDNSGLVELIDGKKGIIQTLNEECLVPKGSDLSFLSKIRAACSANPTMMSTNPRFNDQFTVFHYAGKVTYNVAGFLERNKDTLPEDMKNMLAMSSNPLLARLFGESSGPCFTSQSAESEELLKRDGEFVASYLLLEQSDEIAPTARPGSFSPGRAPSQSGFSTPGAFTPFRSTKDEDGASSSSVKRTNRRSSFMMAETVTMKFKSQLGKLMDTISVTEVQYVRCIKPNVNKSNTEFSRSLVVEQLRSAGMIAAVQITRAAYPSRLLYSEFISRFRLLRPDFWHKDVLRSQVQRKIVDENLQRIDHAKALVGALIHYVFPHIQPLPDDATGDDLPQNISMYQFGLTKVFFAKGILEKWEGFRTEAILEMACVLQNCARRFTKRSKYLRMRRGCILIQAAIRGHLQRRPYRRMLKACIKIQSICRVLRDVIIVQNLRRQTNALKIETWFRCRIQVRHYNYLRIRNRSQILVATAVRGWLARINYIRMLNEHKERLLALERERIENERRERERVERERLAAIERERIEEERRRLEIIQAEQLEQLRLENERIAEEKAANDKIRLAQEEDTRRAKAEKELEESERKRIAVEETSMRQEVAAKVHKEAVRPEVPHIQVGKIESDLRPEIATTDVAPVPVASQPPSVDQPHPQPGLRRQGSGLGLGLGLPLPLSPPHPSPRHQPPPQLSPRNERSSNNNHPIGVPFPSPRGGFTETGFKELLAKLDQLESALQISRGGERLAKEENAFLKQRCIEAEEEAARLKKSMTASKHKLVEQITACDELEAKYHAMQRDFNSLVIEKKGLSIELEEKTSDAIALRQALRQSQLRLTEKIDDAEGSKSFFKGLFKKGHMSTEKWLEMETELMTAKTKVHFLEEELRTERQNNQMLTQFKEELLRSIGSKPEMKTSQDIANMDDLKTMLRSLGSESVRSDVDQASVVNGRRPNAPMQSQLASNNPSPVHAQVQSQYYVPAPALVAAPVNVGQGGPSLLRAPSDSQLTASRRAADNTPINVTRRPSDASINLTRVSSFDMKSSTGSFPMQQAGSANSPPSQPLQRKPSLTIPLNSLSSSQTPLSPPPPYEFASTTTPDVNNSHDTKPPPPRRQGSLRSQSPTPIIIPQSPRLESESPMSIRNRSSPSVLQPPPSNIAMSTPPGIAAPRLMDDTLSAHSSHSVSSTTRSLLPPPSYSSSQQQHTAPQSLLPPPGRSSDRKRTGLPIKDSNSDYGEEETSPVVAVTSSRPHSPTLSVSVDEVSLKAAKSTAGPPILDLNSLKSSVDSNQGLKAKIFLMQKTNQIIEREATIRRLSTSSSDEDLFELEIASGTGGETKRMKFLSSEIKSARNGKGKKMEFEEPDEHCMCLHIKGKGELNIVFFSQLERDISVSLFLSRKKPSPRDDSSSVSSYVMSPAPPVKPIQQPPPSYQHSSGPPPPGQSYQSNPPPNAAPYPQPQYQNNQTPPPKPGSLAPPRPSTSSSGSVATPSPMPRRSLLPPTPNSTGSVRSASPSHRSAPSIPTQGLPPPASANGSRSVSPSHRGAAQNLPPPGSNNGSRSASPAHRPAPNVPGHAPPPPSQTSSRSGAPPPPPPQPVDRRMHPPPPQLPASAMQTPPRPSSMHEESSTAKHGWVLKESITNKSWSKKFAAVDADHNLIKFAASSAAIQFQSQIESTLRLTSDMVCSDGNSWASGDSFLVEVSDSKGLRLRLQVSSGEDQQEWLRSISTIIAGIH